MEVGPTLIYLTSILNISVVVPPSTYGTTNSITIHHEPTKITIDQKPYNDPFGVDSEEEVEEDYEYFEHAKGGWFKLHLHRENFEKAKSICREEGAEIAPALKNGVIDVVQTIMNQHNLNETHIHEPIKWENKDVHTMLVIIEKDSGPMYVKYLPSMPMSAPFVCYKAAEDYANKECATSDTDYNLYNETGSCYKLNKNFLSWCDAMSTCVAEGGRLAIINSDKEGRIPEDIFAHSKTWGMVVHVGVLRLDGGQTWKTTEGQLLSEAGFDTWGYGDPNNLEGDEYCGMFYPGVGLISDPCHRIKPFICEKSPRRFSNKLKKSEKEIVDSVCSSKL